MGHLLLQWQQQYWKVLFLSVEGAVDSSRGDLPQFAQALHNYTKFTSFRELSMLWFAEQTNNPCSIVSSIDFDKDSEYFAVAGVTSKIKVMYTYCWVSSSLTFVCSSSGF